MPSENSENRKVSSLKPLAALFPYLTRHRLQLTLAAFFLFLAAATTLTLPVAVRRVIDRGFSETDSELVNSYFAMLLVIALVLAISSSLRYFFVIWLGERVVADLRRDVFSNVTRLSSEFFDTAKTGEIISRLTADTTQIKSAMGATASLALRNALLGIGAVIMMIYTSPRLSTFVLAAIPLIVFPIIAFGRAVRRRSRHAQDTLAEATAYASESIGAVQTMQSFSNETQVKISFANAVDFAFDAAAKAIRTRSMLTGFAIFLIFSSVVGVLWIGANDVL
ncbi:MAG: ABC transporter transmembrane domain-containing protein, partial [Pseudomonadota bacterium]